MAKHTARTSKYRYENCAHCGKRGYHERSAARKVRNDLNQQGDPGVHVYQCIGAVLWHVGHATPGMMRAVYERDRVRQLMARLQGEANTMLDGDQAYGVTHPADMITLLTAFDSIAWVENAIKMARLTDAGLILKPSRFVPKGHVWAVRGRETLRVVPDGGAV